MGRNFEIDNTDLRILEILMQDAKSGVIDHLYPEQIDHP